MISSHLFADILYASEWLIRLVMLVYVPQRRSPAAARTWLLLIFVFPWPGLALYAVIGRIYLPYRRVEMQQKISEQIRKTGSRFLRTLGLAEPQLEPRFQQTVTLAQKLGDFNILAGNSFELLIDYHGTIERMVADIDAAQHHVHLLYYIFADDEVGRRVEAALVRASGRGVRCRVLIDDWGSKRWLKAVLPRLQQAGVDAHAMLPVSWFRRSAARFDLRNHRKITVIDGKIGYLGSQNLVDPAFKEGITYEELVTRVTGPVVLQLQAVFLTDWNLETGEEVAVPELFPEPERSGRSSAQVLPSGPGFPRANTHRLTVSLLHAARRRVVITTPYCIPDDTLLLALETAVLRGVEVHLIASDKADQFLVSMAQRSFYDQMLEAGVKIHLYTRNFLHAKHLTVDDTITLIGSSNMDIRSFLLNAEVSVLIYDSDVAERMRCVQEQCLKHCRALTLEEWDQRPLPVKVTQNIARLVDSVL